MTALKSTSTVFNDQHERLAALLEVVGQAARILTQDASWEENLPAVLGYIGQTSGLTRIYLYALDPTSQGNPLAHLKSEWHDDELKSKGLIPGWNPLPLGPGPGGSSPGGSRPLARWGKVLARGGMLFGNADAFPPGEREPLKLAGALSILLLPVFSGSTWWGLIGFEDGRAARDWSGSEVNALKTTAHFIGAAVSTAENTQARLLSDERFDTISQHISDFIVALSVNPDGAFTQLWHAGDITRLGGLEQRNAYRPDEWMQLVHPSELEETSQWLNSVLKNGKPQSRELRIQDQDGLPRWVEAHLYPTWDKEQKRVTRLVLVSQNISERKSHESAEHTQHALVAALQDTAATLTTTLDLDEVLDRILINVGEVVPHEGITIMLVQDNIARVVRYRGYASQEFIDALTSLRFNIFETPNLRLMIESGRPVAIADTRLDPGWMDFPEAQWERSYAGAPISIKGQTIGFLNLASARPGFFTMEHAERLQAFANQAAVALENARLFRSLDEHAQRMALLNELTHVAISAPNLQTMLQRLANRIGPLFTADSAFISLWDEAQQHLIPAASFGPGRESYSGWHAKNDEANFLAAVLEAGQVFTADDVFNSPHLSPRAAALLPLRSLMILPLTADAQKFGVVLIGFKDFHHFTTEETTLGEQVAAQMALAVAKAQAFDTERRHSQELSRSSSLIAALSQVATRLAATTDPDQIIETVGVELQRLGVNCLLAMVDPTTRSLSVQYTSIQPHSVTLIEKLTGLKLLGYPLASENHLAERILELKAPAFVSDPHTHIAATLPRIPRPVLWKAAHLAGVDADTPLLVLPLAVKYQGAGVLAVWGAELVADDIPAFSVFANQLAAALENVRLYAETQQLAITDELTGIYNRRGLFELGKREVERVLRFGHPLAGLMIDIDHFKQVNDTYGHPTGDRVLRSLADRLRRNIRDIDIIGRYGGEEFVILLIENDITAAAMVAERLRKLVMETPMPTDQGPIRITVSMGIAAVTPDTPDLSTLITRADQALYQAKQAGRNRVMVR